MELAIVPRHAAALALLVGRASRAWGVSRPGEDLRFRVAGMAPTSAAIGGAAPALVPG